MLTETSVRTIEPDVTVLAISGRLSLGNALLSVESSIKRVVAEGARKLILDLAGLQQIDSAGIGMLMLSNAEVEKFGGRLRIAGATGMVARVCEISHLNQVIGLDPDVDSACQSLA